VLLSIISVQAAKRLVIWFNANEESMGIAGLTKISIK